MFLFVGRKLALVEPAKRRFMNCYCIQTYYIKTNTISCQNLSLRSISWPDLFPIFLLFLISKLLTFLSQNENELTTCSKIANANFVGPLLAYSVFLFNFNDLRWSYTFNMYFCLFNFFSILFKSNMTKFVLPIQD